MKSLTERLIILPCRYLSVAELFSIHFSREGRYDVHVCTEISDLEHIIKKEKQGPEAHKDILLDLSPLTGTSLSECIDRTQGISEAKRVFLVDEWDYVANAHEIPDSVDAVIGGSSTLQHVGIILNIVATGGRYICSPRSTDIPDRKRASGHGLTGRQREVFRLLREGLTNSEIALKLHISGQTVNFHTRNIYKVLGVRTRSQAVRVYYESKGNL